MQVVLLLLKSASQVLNILFFLLQVHVHLLGLSPQASVLVTCNVVLDLKIAVHVAEFFLLCLSEYGCLVGL